MTISGSNVSIPAYSQADDRSASLSVTASTTANSSYNGTASVSCAWTVTQKGTGTTVVANKSIYITSYYTGTTTVYFTITANGESAELTLSSGFNDNADLDVGSATGGTIVISLESADSDAYTVMAQFSGNGSVSGNYTDMAVGNTITLNASYANSGNTLTLYVSQS